MKRIFLMNCERKYNFLNINVLFASLIIGLIILLSPARCLAQSGIENKRSFIIKADTITRFDTTFIIDTIIKEVTFIKYDTIFDREEPVAEDVAENKDEDIVRKFECSLGMTVNQLAITHWAAGGESNTSGKLTANFKYNYNRPLFNYETAGIFAYGRSNYAKDKRKEKTEDRCELSLTMKHNNKKRLTFTSMATLKTQFTNGYSYPNDSIPISKFFAPAYLTLSIGYTYNIHDIVTIFASPAAGRITFVTDQDLADKGAFGVEASYWNVINGDSILVHGKNFLGELGFNLLIKYKQNFRDNISVFSTLNFYNNYMDVNKENRWNIDVDWETGFKFNISKSISTILNIHLIYDDNIKFSVTEIVNGEEITKQKPILQFKESLGITFLYKFAT